MGLYLVNVVTTTRRRKWVVTDDEYDAKEIGYEDAYEKDLDDYELADETVEVWVGKNI